MLVLFLHNRDLTSLTLTPLRVRWLYCKSQTVTEVERVNGKADRGFTDNLETHCVGVFICTAL